MTKRKYDQATQVLSPKMVRDKYLQSPEWEMVKAKRFALDKGRCWCCQMDAVDAYRITGKKTGNEQMCDLVSVCRRCHLEIKGHLHNPVKGQVKAHKLVRLARHPNPNSYHTKKSKPKKRKVNPDTKAQQRALKESLYRCLTCHGETKKTYSTSHQPSGHRSHHIPMCSACLRIATELETQGGVEKREVPKKVKVITALDPCNRKEILYAICSVGVR